MNKYFAIRCWVQWLKIHKHLWRTTFKWEEAENESQTKDLHEIQYMSVQLQTLKIKSGKALKGEQPQGQCKSLCIEIKKLYTTKNKRNVYQDSQHKTLPKKNISSSKQKTVKSSACHLK